MKFVEDAILFHASMLNDRRRTAGYLASIRDVVKPGDVVVDIGTGTGILAIAAVRAGARHVYAIEEARIARVARTLFEANGMTDHITLIRGRSTEVRLPQRADVLTNAPCCDRKKRMVRADKAEATLLVPVPALKDKRKAFPAIWFLAPAIGPHRFLLRAA